MNTFRNRVSTASQSHHPHRKPLTWVIFMSFPLIQFSCLLKLLEIEALLSGELISLSSVGLLLSLLRPGSIPPSRPLIESFKQHWHHCWFLSDTTSYQPPFGFCIVPVSHQHASNNTVGDHGKILVDVIMNNIHCSREVCSITFPGVEMRLISP